MKNVYSLIGSLKKVYRLLQPCEKRNSVTVVFLISLMSVLNFVSLASVFPLLKIVFDGDLKEDQQSGLILTAVFFGILVVKNTAMVKITNMVSDFTQRQFKHYSSVLLDSYFKQGILFVKEKGPVSLAKDVNALCHTYSYSVLQSILLVFGECLFAIIVLLFLFCWHPQLTFRLFCIVFPLFVVYSIFTRRRLQILGNELQNLRRRQAKLVVELFRGFADLKVYNAFDTFYNDFLINIDNDGRISKTTTTLRQLPVAMCEIIIFLVFVFLMLIPQSEDTSESVFYAVAFIRFIPSLRSIVSYCASFQQAKYSIDVLFNELVVRQMKDVSNSFEINFSDRINVDNVSFSYPSGRVVLSNVSLSIKKGEFLGIKGASGIGKTTLINILSGLLTPVSGQLSVDGVMLNKNNVKSWHKLIGYVPQDVFILTGTIIENVTLGSDFVDEARVEHVLKLVQLQPWLHELPCGIRTQLGESGCYLSGGQRQRIGLARALYKKSHVLFIDEPTSALDYPNEMEIVGVLKTLSCKMGITIIMVSHKASSLAFCSRVFSL